MMPDVDTFKKMTGLDEIEGNIEGFKEVLIWGTCGKEGGDTYRTVLLKDCSDAHLENILVTQPHINMLYKRVILELLKDRYTGKSPSIED